MFLSSISNALFFFLAATDIDAKKTDLCAAIAGKEWVAPRDVRACFTSFEVDPAVKENIIEVVNKTLAFHTSVSYELKAPEPFTSSVHEDVLGDLARISKQSYASDYDLHIDLSRTLKRLQDGHCVWINYCYVCQSSLCVSSMLIRHVFDLKDCERRVCRLSNYLYLQLSLIRELSAHSSGPLNGLGRFSKCAHRA